jgi:hypothetical protein
MILKCHITFIVMPNIIMLSVTFHILLCWMLLCLLLLCLVFLFWVLLYWVSHFNMSRFIYCYAECHYARARSIESYISYIVVLTAIILRGILLSVTFHVLLCWMSLCQVSHFIYGYAKCHYAKARSTDSYISYIVMLTAIMLTVVMLIVVMPFSK